MFKILLHLCRFGMSVFDIMIPHKAKEDYIYQILVEIWNNILSIPFVLLFSISLCHDSYSCCLLLRRRSVQGESDEINQNLAQIPQAYDAAPASKMKFNF